MSTMPVTSAPNPLMAALVFQRDPRIRRQCTTIPACDKVKDTKTPTMYSGMSEWVSPPYTMSRTAAKMLNPMMPLEKASRSPWFISCRGR